MTLVFLGMDSSILALPLEPITLPSYYLHQRVLVNCIRTYFVLRRVKT